MNEFDSRVMAHDADALCAEGLSILQINLGRRCNLSCTHCHLACSPERKEMMSEAELARTLEVVCASSCSLVGITGGSPELHPGLRSFITDVIAAGKAVQVRTNLVLLTDPDLADLPEFFKDHAVRLVASMPCYLEENVDAQRGDGTYEKIVDAIRKLNELGYGGEKGLQLNLLYNPGGAVLPGPQGELEGAYKRELKEREGIEFSNLLVITNMPIGRFSDQLEKEGGLDKYMRDLKGAFNPGVLRNLMCRHQVCIDWDGALYDCDFNLALGIMINHGAPDRLNAFDESAMIGRRIMTGEHCFGCTAGAGSSCGGELE